MDPSALEIMLAEAEIKSLVVREKYYRDTSQWQKLRDSWHDDASKTRVNITWLQGNIDDFVAGSRKMAANSASVIHNVHPIEIHHRGTKAVSESRGSILVRFDYEDTSYDLTSYVQFVSRLERLSSGWKMTRFEVIYEKGGIQPVSPTADGASLVVEGSRESYKCLSWVLSLKGFAVDQNLPGTDLPDSTEALRKEAFNWLEKED